MAMVGSGSRAPYVTAMLLAELTIGGCAGRQAAAQGNGDVDTSAK